MEKIVKKPNFKNPKLINKKAINDLNKEQLKLVLKILGKVK